MFLGVKFYGLEKHWSHFLRDFGIILSHTMSTHVTGLLSFIILLSFLNLIFKIYFLVNLELSLLYTTDNYLFLIML